MREFNSLRLFSFLFFHVDSSSLRGVFAFFSLVFVNQVFFVFFLFSLLLFSLRLHLTLRRKKLLLSPWYVSSLSFRIFSLSLCSREEEEKEYESRSKVPSLRPVVFRAREMRVVFLLTRCGFSANFWAKKSPLSHEERVLSANVGNRARVNSRATSILSKLR